MLNLSLRTKILLLVAGTATGLVSVILLAFTLLVSREVSRAVQGDVRATGGMLGQMMQERDAALLQQSRVLANDLPLLAALSTRDPATVLDKSREYLARLAADGLIVTGQDGHVLADTDGLSVPRADLSADAGVAAALANGEWTGITLRRGRLMQVVSVPVRIGAYPWGTLTAFHAIDPSVARGLQASLGTEVAFVSAGRVVGASRPLPPVLPTPHTPAVVSVGGTRFFALYASLPGTNPAAQLGYVTLRPYAAAMGLYRRCLGVFLAASLVTLALALSGGAWVARGLTRPLEGVVKAAQVLQGGGWPERFTRTRADEIGLLQSVFNDMTVALRESRERLLALIDMDALTGLDNHRRFQERLEQEARRCAASGEHLSLLLLDLDHFSVYNQQHGHGAGDEALRRMAQAISSCLPEVALAARYGGEQFAVLLPRCDLTQAEAVAEKMRAAAAALLPGLTASIGCAERAALAGGSGGLTLAAELAVSRAKQMGRDRVCRFDALPGADTHADPYELHRFLADESLAAIQALAAAVDAKDPYTQGHSQRVAGYAVALARALGMVEDDVALVHTTGTLHDVGKIGVPDAVLKKPGRLDSAERQTMETHPALGEVIVRKVPKLAASLPGVRHHHERWDGGGYPDSLAREAIPPIARILAVADTFDAMTSDRPYRKGMSQETALAEIARGAGTQFEPRLSAAFVALMRAADIPAQAA